MTQRIDFSSSPIAGKVFRHLRSAAAATHGALPFATQELVKIRTSQINGCGLCVDMHTKDAAAGGESQVRLHLVATWREATVFTDAERAALELAETGSRLADGGRVPDEVWDRAAEHYDSEELTALVAVIANINAWNRLNVMTQQPGGSYEVGQFG